MKKIMIAVAVIAMATASQAANWKWGIANVFDGTGSTETTAKVTGTAYLFDSAVLTQSALYDALANGGDIATLTSVTSRDFANGIVNANDAASQFVYGEGGMKYSFYAVIVDGDQAYFSNIKEVTANTTSTTASIALGSQNNNSTTFSSLAPAGEGFQGAGHWSAVPEPTSGLLMLVGLAGLALRRKRA